MCEYCEKGKGICKNKKTLGIELHSAKAMLVSYGLDKEGCDISVYCKINYCPMCRTKTSRKWTKNGRKLGDDKR